MECWLLSLGVTPLVKLEGFLQAGIGSHLWSPCKRPASGIQRFRTVARHIAGWGRGAISTKLFDRPRRCGKRVRFPKTRRPWWRTKPGLVAVNWCCCDLFPPNQAKQACRCHWFL